MSAAITMPAWTGEGEDLRGAEYGRLTVVAPAPSGPRGVRVATRCSCGRIAVRHVADLVSGRARACARCRPDEIDASPEKPAAPPKARALIAYFADPEIVARFETYVSPEPNTGCWLWLGALDKDGYGKFSITNALRRRRRGGKQHQVHMRAARFALAIRLGRWPHADLVVGHRCGMPACVNPDHLVEEPRRAMFARRKPARGYDWVPPDRRPRGESHGNAVLSNADVRDIRARRKAGERPSDLAREYGVVLNTISAVASGRYRRTG